MDSKKVLKLFALIILCEVVGSIGVIFTYPAIPTWYAFINKPFFSPPNWLFAPAWIILFLLMGVALYLILESKSSNQKNLARHTDITQCLIVGGLAMAPQAI